MIEVDDSEMVRLKRKLESASKNAPRDMKRALSSTRRTAGTQTSRIMTETYTAGKQSVNRRVKVTPVNSAELSFSIVASKKPIELQEFKHSVSKRKGAKVKVFKAGSAQALPHAFRKQPGKSRIYQRVKAPGGGLVGRFPIKVLRGPSTADILAKKQVEQSLRKVVVERLRSELIRLTKVAISGKD